MRSMPSTEIITVKPANTTARPERVHRLDHRGLGRSRPVERGAVAGDDEQRVVDADADADHRRDLRREARRREDRGDRRPMPASEIAMPMSAVTIGRPIAISEPNAISSTMIAARMPMTSLAGHRRVAEPSAGELHVHAGGLHRFGEILDVLRRCPSDGRRRRSRS